MRIALVIHHELDPDTGAPGAAWQLGSAYRELGHDVTFISWDDVQRPSGRARELLWPFAAARLLRERGPFDVVDAMTGDAWLWARRRGRTLLVTRSHGLEHVFYAAERRERRPGLATRAYHGHLRLREVEWSLRAADLSLFANDEDRQIAVTRLGVAEDRAEVFENGISSDLAASPMAPPGPLRIVQIGSWHPRKGSAVLVEAATTVLRRLPDATLHLLGTGDASVPAAFPASIRERVTNVPRYARSNLTRLLADAHVLVLPSLAEGQSLAVLEGMAAGLCPVVSPAAGVGLVADGVDGMVVPPEPGPLAAALAGLASDHDRLQRLRTAARARAADRVWPLVAARELARYERALGLMAMRPV